MKPNLPRSPLPDGMPRVVLGAGTKPTLFLALPSRPRRPPAPPPPPSSFPQTSASQRGTRLHTASTVLSAALRSPTTRRVASRQPHSSSAPPTSTLRTTLPSSTEPHEEITLAAAANTTSSSSSSSSPSTSPSSSSSPPAAQPRHDATLEHGYLSFTKSQLFKLVLPITPHRRIAPAEQTASERGAKSSAERNPDSTLHSTDADADADGGRRGKLRPRNPNADELTGQRRDGAAADAESKDGRDGFASPCAPHAADSVIFLIHSAQPIWYISELIRSEGLDRPYDDADGDGDGVQGAHDRRRPLPDAPGHVGSATDATSSRAGAGGARRPPGLPWRGAQVSPRTPDASPITFHTRGGGVAGEGRDGAAGVGETADGEERIERSRWSPATGLGDFLREASKRGSFVIRIGPRRVLIRVPSFEDRSRFLRATLYAHMERIESMAKLKSECDGVARMATRRLAYTGAAALASWWLVVAYLSFGTEHGWDVIEPVVTVTGLGGAMAGYIWFLLHDRDVTYRAVLKETTSRRQQALYAQRGLDIEAYEELVERAKALRASIKAIANDYDLEWDQGETSSGKRSRRALDVVRRRERLEEKGAGAAAAGTDRREDDEEDEGSGQSDEVREDHEAARRAR